MLTIYRFKGASNLAIRPCGMNDLLYFVRDNKQPSNKSYVKMLDLAHKAGYAYIVTFNEDKQTRITHTSWRAELPVT